MTTSELRELAGVSPVAEQSLPAESKYDSDNKRDEAKLHRIEAKELREFNQPMVEFNYHKELTDVLWNPRDKIMQQLNQWNYKIITNEEAPYTPYRLVA